MAAPKYIKNADGHFVCPHCQKVTEKQNTMYYHIKKHHEQDLPFECDRCPDHPRFLQKTSYFHHLATAHPDAPHPEQEKAVNPYAGVTYGCPCCAHTTHTKANVIIHFARNHCKDWIPSYEKKSPCSGCCKSFASSSAYLYHAVNCFKSQASEDQLNMFSRIK